MHTILTSSVGKHNSAWRRFEALVTLLRLSHCGASLPNMARTTNPAWLCAARVGRYSPHSSPIPAFVRGAGYGFHIMWRAIASSTARTYETAVEPAPPYVNGTEQAKQQLSAQGPAFALSGESVKVLVEPNEFYSSILVSPKMFTFFAVTQ